MVHYVMHILFSINLNGLVCSLCEEENDSQEITPRRPRPLKSFPSLALSLTIIKTGMIM